MSGRLEVCHLVHHLALGGLEKQLLRMIRASSEGVTHTVGYFGSDESLAEEFETAAAEVTRLAGPPEAPARQFDPRRLRAVARYLGAADPDVLHCHTSLYLHVLGRLCARWAGIPVIGTYHNTSDSFHPAMRLAERVTRPLSPVSIAVSKGVERSFAADAGRFDPDAPLARRTCTVYNGIDVAGFAEAVEQANPVGTPAAEDGLTLLCIGRYAPEKNQQLLLDAAARTEGLGEWHLLLVGWGETETTLRETAADLGIDDRVTLTGRVPSVHGYYASADAFVLPSTTEGLSVTLLEAMSAGLPVVATRVAGTTEAVVDGETGFIVAPESRRSLAQGLEQLTTVDLSRLGANGYRRAKRWFDISRTVTAYETVYRALADG